MVGGRREEKGREPCEPWPWHELFLMCNGTELVCFTNCFSTLLYSVHIPWHLATVCDLKPTRVIMWYKLHVILSNESGCVSQRGFIFSSPVLQPCLMYSHFSYTLLVFRFLHIPEDVNWVWGKKMRHCARSDCFIFFFFFCQMEKISWKKSNTSVT